MRSTWKRIAKVIQEDATFFRIHLVCFMIIPLIFSGIFYACNGRFHISYLDSLFLCYSAMTVTGLSTVNLSTTTAWQQVMLYLLMAMGDFTVVSWIMVLVRKHYFRRRCEYIEPRGEPGISKLSQTRTALINAISAPVSAVPWYKQDAPSGPAEAKGGVPSAPLSSQETTAPHKPDGVMFGVTSPTPSGTLLEESPTPTQNLTGHLAVSNGTPVMEGQGHFLSDLNTLSSSPRGENGSLPPSSPVVSPAQQGVEFANSVSMTPSVARRRLATIQETAPYARTATMVSNRTQRSYSRIPGDPTSSKHSGLGGFPGPVTLAKSVVQRMLPGTYRKLERKLTLSHTITLNAQQTSQEPLFARENAASWLKFNGLTVGRNSLFHTDTLTDEQLEEIGGVEYRALRLLSYLVAFYFIGTQLFAYILFAPWLASTHQYDDVFEAQPRPIPKPWFSLFQVMGGYTGGGLSLVDLGMVPFQRAYLLIFALMFVILAGNHALPIFLRLLIWIYSKLVPRNSRTYETLSFLLDHPRRCFVYLFPMHQTWFLVACLVLFSALEWASFLVLDIGLEVTDSLPAGTRVVNGLFQGLAARASGFSIVPVASLAPAVQFLYVVMMYIAVYPVAMSIRATNVYEERSLGVFEAPPDDEDEEPQLSGTRRERLGKYLGWHLRRQLSIDIWWLVWAVFIICIIERDNLLDESKKWFDIFRVLFELVSAFGGIGLSLGLPSDNFSFAGALKPLSKLVIIVIMVRGRHRGLPVAVDRSILLPQELVLQQQPVQAEKPDGDIHAPQQDDN